MLNRNDRVSLRRNRNAVSWLILLIIFLIIWIANLRQDVNYQIEENIMILTEMRDIQNSNDKKDKKIDSLTRIINYIPIDTPVIVNKPAFQPYKSTVKKDTSTVYQKVDSTKDVKKDLILKDTIK